MLPDVQPIQCFCDNLGVITNINRNQESLIPRPNDATTDDCDLFLAIAAVIRTCTSVEFQFLYVKGHQDTKVDRPLTLAEQYNVECDHLAKLYVGSSSVLSTSMNNPEFEAAQPHLHIDNKVICRRFLPTLREHAAKPAYMEYLSTKFKWTQVESKQVHWQALHHAIRILKPNDQRRIVLFINNKLPLRTSKAHPHPGSQLCPSCQREPEDTQHFLECDHINRCCLFETLHSNITEVATKYTLHPGLITALWLGLLAIRTATPCPNIQNDLPPIIVRAISSQQQIGWNQLYQGRFSKHWAQAINHLHPRLALAGRQIITILIQAIWKYVIATWTQRNTHLHNDNGTMSLPDYRNVVQAMYEQRHQLPPETQEAIFY